MKIFSNIGTKNLFYILPNIIFTCILLINLQGVQAQEILQLQGAANYKPVYGNDALDIKLILKDVTNAVGSTTDLNAAYNIKDETNILKQPSITYHSIRFDVVSEVPFADGAMTSTINSIFNPNATTPQPDISGYAGNMPINSTIQISNGTPTNINTKGEAGTLMCIISVDDLLRDQVEDCYEYKLILTNVELIHKVDASTNESSPNDIIIPILGDTITVNFCPKCNVSNLQVNPICAADSSSYNAEIYFEGIDNHTYTISDNKGSATQTGAAGTYIFGNYPSAEQIEFTVVDNNNPTSVCTFLAKYNCSIYTPPSCSDNISNNAETGIDCGGEDCPSCNPCGLRLDANVILTTPNEFAVALDITADQEMQFNAQDNVGNTYSLANGTHIIGNYSADQHIDITVSQPNNAQCTASVYHVSYAHPDTCNFTPANNFCADATPLSSGTNGPYNNACATAENYTDHCFTDRLTNTLWYTFTGTGGVANITAINCAGTYMDYAQDLQFMIFTDCSMNNLIACSEDEVFYQPTLQLPTIAGQTYYLAVDGYGQIDPIGRFCLEVCFSPRCTLNQVVQAGCSGLGSISVDVTAGSPPYTYLWSNDATEESLENLSPGQYSLTATDALGCQCELEQEITAEAIGLHIEPTANSQGISGSGVFSYNTITLQVQNATYPLSYDWDISGFVRYSTPNPNEIVVIYNDNAQWSVQVTDATNCQGYYSNSNTSNLLPNPTDNILDIVDQTITHESNYFANDGSISITASGGTPPYMYIWSTGETGSQISNLSSKWYYVTVTDSSPQPQTTLGGYWIRAYRAGRNKTALSNDGSIFIIQPNITNIQGQSQLTFVPANAGQYTATLQSVQGKAPMVLFTTYVEENELVQQPISVESLGLLPGIYIITIAAKDNNALQYRKFIVY